MASAAGRGFRSVARRDDIETDAIEHERRAVFGVQFHPEAREEFMRLRGMPQDPRQARAFADQARLLESFRTLLLARRSGS